MVEAGDKIVYAGGSVRKFIKTGAETNGELLEMEMLYPPHSEPPVEHYHPRQEECFIVHEGEIRAALDGQVRVYRAGEAFTIPVNTMHWMHNQGEGQTRVTWQVRPALTTAEFFQTHYRLTKDKPMNLLQTMLLMQKYHPVFRPAKPPFWLLSVLIFLLAPLARIFGYSLPPDQR